MHKKLLRLWKDCKGSTSITMLGIAAVIVLFALFFLELQEMYDTQFAIEMRAQRAVNSTVEYAMDDSYRADGFNFMDTTIARNTLETFLNEDLNVNADHKCYSADGHLLYSVDYDMANAVFSSGDPRDGTTPAGISISITVHMTAGIGKYFGQEGGYTWTNVYQSKNFRTDDNERRGIWPSTLWTRYRNSRWC